VTDFLVPYHLDEQLPDLDVPLRPAAVVTAELSDGDPWQRMAHLYAFVAAAVADDIRDGHRPVVLSGDCTTSLAIVAGMQRTGLDPAIVWFDAHGDLQTLETTTSGYLGGMPLRILTGYRPELIADALGIRPVAEERIVLVDARDLDPPEEEYLASAAIQRSNVDRLTADRVPPGPVYLHVDLDVVDPEDLPGLLFPAPGGPALDAVAAAISRVVATGRVAAVGVGCTWHGGRGAADRVRPHLRQALAGAPG
jgi:arginase